MMLEMENEMKNEITDAMVTDTLNEIADTMEANIPDIKLSSIQRNFIELDKRFVSEIKPFLDAYKVAKEAVAIEVGIEGHFQDGEGTVYQAVVPEGRFVAFDRYAVKRTRREGETKGDLSMTAARELGYIVENKGK